MQQGVAEEARQHGGEIDRERPAIGLGDDDRLKAGQDQPQPGAGRQDHGQDHRHIVGELRAGALGAMGFVGAHRELEQQHVERRADRRENAGAEIVGEGELPGFAEPVEPADYDTVGERNELKQHRCGDQRQAIAHEFPGERRLRLGRRGACVLQGAPGAQQGRGNAQADARERDLRRLEPPRAADGQDQIQDVFHDDRARIGAVMEERARERRAVVIEAAGDRERRRHEKQARRQRQGEPAEAHGDGGEADDRGERAEAHIERGAHLRTGVARARGIKTHRREPDPVEAAGVDDHRRRRGDREAAEFRGAEEFGDEQPDEEIEHRVQSEGEADDHRSDPVRARRASAPVQRRWIGKALW